MSFVFFLVNPALEDMRKLGNQNGIFYVSTLNYKKTCTRSYLDLFADRGKREKARPSPQCGFLSEDRSQQNVLWTRTQQKGARNKLSCHQGTVSPCINKFASLTSLNHSWDFKEMDGNWKCSWKVSIPHPSSMKVKRISVPVFHRNTYRLIVVFLF